MSLTSTAVVRAFNHLLSSATWARERLMPFVGSVVHLRIEPLDMRFLIDTDGLFSEAPDPDVAADVVITLPLTRVPGALLGESNGLMNAVTLQGNAELADALGFVVRNLEWDTEDDLARLIGDIPARRISLAAQALKTSGNRAFESFTGNLSEYLTEEQPLLVPRDALLSFSDEVRVLRDDLARLEKRTERLLKRSVSAGLRGRRK